MIMKSKFGKMSSGEDIHLYTMKNRFMEIDVSTLGAALVSARVPDSNGKIDDVVLGYDSGEEYINNSVYIGVVVGRSANRVGPAQINLDGMDYKLLENDGENNLHSGKIGMGRRLFHGEEFRNSQGVGVKLTLMDPHLADGFPGIVETTITYFLTEGNRIEIEYKAVANMKTVLNLTNHSYFNLGGHQSGDISNHELLVASDFYTPNDFTGLPTGEIKSVRNTSLDLNCLTPLEDVLTSKEKEITDFNGLDHNYLLKGFDYRKVAALSHGKSGRCMEVYTTLPSMQVYTGNYLNNTKGKNNSVYGDYSGIALETQLPPNSVHLHWLKSSVYSSGEVYRSKTGYQFYW